MKRNTYLDMQPLQQAIDGWLEAFDWVSLAGTETITTAKALGRVTSTAVFARLSAPSYAGAAMDGVALRAEDSFGASDESPLRLRVEEQAWFINTGGALPPGCDAVVMIEQVHQPDMEHVELRAAAFPWQHVRRVGEDVVVGEMVLPRHHRLQAADLAALLNAGVFEINVLQRPRVVSIPTGSELVHWRDAQKEAPAPGAIIESNSVLLSGLVTEAQATPLVQPLQPDDHDTIRSALAEALASNAHMVVLNAGASAGSRDHTVHVLAELGEVLTHGVTVMPGKPTILGRAAGKPVIGTPGFPVSAWVCFDQFIGPALAMMQGQAPPQRPVATVTPGRHLASRLGREEFLRVHLGRVGERIVATPLKRGAGLITSMVRADGIIRIAADSEGAEQGQPINAELLRPAADLEDTLVITGSHDVTLDLLADRMHTVAPWIRVSSSSVGSLAGLVAMAGGQGHVGGCHLLDPDSGEYNVSWVQRHLQGQPTRLLTLAWRQQGLMVLPGNPKGITSLSDLTRSDVMFVNRQAGSGTRLLLDHELGRQGIHRSSIAGYNVDEYTHTGVAVQVRSGCADAGLGILAAARALGLDFVPVARERYDLCIPEAHWDDRRVKVLRQVVSDPTFLGDVEGLGGYDTAEAGRVVWQSEADR